MSHQTFPRLLLGSCPDSWGVWYPDDPSQPPWDRFLDEFAAAGYKYLELGPPGYLPTDPAILREEVARRGLTVVAGTICIGGLHKSDEFEGILAATHKVAVSTSAMGANHLIFVPAPGYRDSKTGAYFEPAELDPASWKTMISAINAIGRQVYESFGLRLQFHNHADCHVETQSQIEQFLDDTDPAYVSLCLDTGHLAYTGGDNVAIIERFPSRIGYVHIKQMEPAVVSQAVAKDMSFGQAVAIGASCEPPGGVPDLSPIISALAALDTDLYLVVEQDIYGRDVGEPKVIAERTFKYLVDLGIAHSAPAAAQT